jgi:hypothetical protein
MKGGSLNNSDFIVFSLLAGRLRPGAGCWLPINNILLINKSGPIVFTRGEEGRANLVIFPAYTEWDKC